jgi:hypothetical protein
LEEKISVYNVFVGEPEGKRLLERLNMKMEDNINIDLKEIKYM